MPQDRKKLLEALVAKRKAESESGGRKKPAPSSFSKHSSKTVKDKPKAHSLHVKKHQHQKKKQVKRYESSGSDEEDHESEESEEKPVRKLSKAPVNVKPVKGKAPLKYDDKGVGKDTKGKEKSKHRDSSEEGEEEEQGSDVSENEVDISNIIPEGRRRSSQSVRYDIENVSDDDGDDDDDDSDD